jgi:hypothetical protein
MGDEADLARQEVESSPPTRQPDGLPVDLMRGADWILAEVSRSKGTASALVLAEACSKAWGLKWK